MKHHAGTAPISTTPPRPSRPTMHQPSSNELITTQNKEKNGGVNEIMISWLEKYVWSTYQ